MTEFYLKLNCNFNESDKEECKPVIYRLIDLANLARREGILALELEMEEEQSIFLKTAIGLVVDGTDPVLVKQILQAAILADKYSGSQLLSRLLMAEGALSLQRGENPRIITMKLSAMMGEKYISEIAEEHSTLENSRISYYQLLKSIREKHPFPESSQFETKLLQMDNRSIQLVLRSVEYPALFTALLGCSYTLIQKIFENVSMRICSMLVKEWETTKTLDKEYIMYCQTYILEKITMLENKGEIADVSKFANRLSIE